MGLRHSGRRPLAGGEAQMLTRTLCPRCVCWVPLSDDPTIGRCHLGPEAKTTHSRYWCWSGQQLLACPPCERLEGVDEGPPAGAGKAVPDAHG